MPAPITGQAVCTGINNAIPLSATPVSCQAFEVKAPASNLSAVWIGPSTVTSTTGHQLDPGSSFVYERSSQHGQPAYQLAPSDFYVAGATGTRVTWFASPS